jgi:hypothetical protein
MIDVTDSGVITINGVRYIREPQPAPPAEPGIAKGTRWQNNASGRILLGECADVPALFRSNHTPLIPLPIGTIVFKTLMEGGKAAVRKARKDEWILCSGTFMLWNGAGPSEHDYPILTRHVVQPDGTLKETP